MSNAIRNGLRTGIIFGIITIFMALIGFTVTLSNLVGRLLGANTSSGQMPSLIYFILLIAIIGILNGYSALKPSEAETWKSTLITGLSAGIITGLLVAPFALGIGTLNSRGIDVRFYLSELSPDSMTLFLFNMDPVPGAIIHLLLITLSSLAGSSITRVIRHGNYWQKLINKIKQVISPISSNPQYKRFSHWRYSRFVLYGLLATALIILPRQWGSYWNYVLGTVGIYIILGLGLNIIVGLSGQLVLGYVAYFAIGAYSFALLTAPEPHHLLWNFWIAAAVSIVLATISGILLALPILRLRGDYLAIVTLGFGEITRIMIKSDILTPLTAGPRGVGNVAGPSLFGISLSSDIDFMYIIIVAVAGILFISNRLQNSRAGRAWLAIRDDEMVAQATGIDRFQYKLLSLAIGAAFAGLGGVLFASRNQFTGPEDHVMMVSINVLCLVIVGGMGSLPGIILGAFALKGLPEILREVEDYRLLVFGALLVVMMIIRPEGLFPSGRPRLEQVEEQQLPESNDQTK